MMLSKVTRSLSFKMAAILGKGFILFALFVFFGAWIEVKAELTCPQQIGGSRSDDINKRTRSLADSSPFTIEDKSKKFSYTIYLCNKGGAGGIAVNQLDEKTQGKEFAIGVFKGAQVFGGSDWLMITYPGGPYNHHCNNTRRKCIFFIQCDRSADTHKKQTPQILEEYSPSILQDTFCYYLFEMKHSGACPPQSKAKISPGSVFIIIVVIVGVLYLVLGLLYQRFIVGAKGLEQIPNYLLWREFGTLQADGCNYMCRCKTAREPTRYKPVDDAIADDDEQDEKDDTLLPM